MTGDSVRGLIGKIIVLGLVAGLAAAMAVPLISGEQWLFLAVLILTTVAIFVVYLQPWHIPIKYLVPGTIFLIAFQVIPVIATFGTAFTNFGDGHRGSKEDAVRGIETASVSQVAGSAEYVLTIATTGDAVERRSGLPALRPGDQDGPAGHHRGPHPGDGRHGRPHRAR